MGALKAKQLLDTIEKALAKQKSGASYAEIRKELELLSVPDDQISYVINRVDEQVLAEAQQEEDGKRTFRYMIVGALLCLTGALITLATYFMEEVDNSLYVIAFGPFMGGYVMFRRAYHKYRKKDA